MRGTQRGCDGCSQLDLCSFVMKERRRKARRPATLPSVSDVGAQVHVDILMV